MARLPTVLDSPDDILALDGDLLGRDQIRVDLLRRLHAPVGPKRIGVAAARRQASVVTILIGAG
jgi:hypothetical protein